jgi:2-hydroxychromene-2-carboxylate isomerase
MKFRHGLALMILLGAGLVCAQDWKTAASLPDVDLSHLTAAQRATALKVLRAQNCSCGCGRKLAQCRVEDPQCSYSTGMAKAVVDAVAQGKNADEAQQAAITSRWGTERKLLDDPIDIPVGGSPWVGPANAPITVVEFSDFQCPYCAAAIPEIQALLKAYPAQVKLVFKQYPLEFHPQAALAAAAALAAQKQGKFWQMHDALFAAHDQLSRDKVFELARQNGLDMKRFETDLNSTAVREEIMRDVQDGDKAGVEGTPTLFINGQRYNGPILVSSLKPVFDAELKPGAKLARR